jgi:hypothetical protein
MKILKATFPLLFLLLVIFFPLTVSSKDPPVTLSPMPAPIVVDGNVEVFIIYDKHGHIDIWDTDGMKPTIKQIHVYIENGKVTRVTDWMPK